MHASIQGTSEPSKQLGTQNESLRVDMISDMCSAHQTELFMLYILTEFLKKTVATYTSVCTYSLTGTGTQRA